MKIVVALERFQAFLKILTNNRNGLEHATGFAQFHNCEFSGRKLCTTFRLFTVTEKAVRRLFFLAKVN